MVEVNLEGPYEPTMETEIYDFWEREGLFKPEAQRKLGITSDSGPRFCITLPPPNVTGQLHLGHAITIAIEDFFTRYNRLQGKETLFLPGSDHAGIATQNVVERELQKEGLHRKELGREEFVKKVWEWKEEYHARITKQSRSLGMSSDWDRERFTLDENLSRAVREAFHRLYEKGLIYRGSYMVNWCPRCESAISDLEAEPEETTSSLWYIKYPVITGGWTGPSAEWGSGKWAEGATSFIEVATTRPETLLGDTGVATSPSHPSFKALIGKAAVLPGNGRAVPIFADDYVDPEFGTGALKITPGHDPNDYEIGMRHDLEFISVIGEDGNMTSEHSVKYAGMDRFECREAIVADLDKEGLLVKIDPYVHSEPHCQRCHTVIEPLISQQWFVKTEGLASAAMDAVRDGRSTIIPEREEKRFFHWMENIKDWCISRQLWWGHRIPVWYCPEGHQTCAMEDPVECATCGSKDIVQDEDVLDTWFSSGLWPFSTLGWPDQEHADLKRFYPTDMRETGYDILFFWVAREMMLGIELTGETPYKMIYLHGIVRNEKGKKISKSMENVEQYDPLNIIEEYGADTLRYTLVSNAVPGRDVNLDPRQFEAARRFCNKIWQSTKYVLSHVPDGFNAPAVLDSSLVEELELPDKWILSRLSRVIKSVTGNIENNDLLNATREMKNFFWNEFCDWYVEFTKFRLYSDDEGGKRMPRIVLLHVLKSCLVLMHPVMPFITEILWQALPDSIKTVPALIVDSWPALDDGFIDESAEELAGLCMALIGAIRSCRADFNVPAGADVPLLVEENDSAGRLFSSMEQETCGFAKIDPKGLKVGKDFKVPPQSVRIMCEGLTAYMPLGGLVNVEEERARLQKELAKVEKYALSIDKKLSGPFSSKAPENVVAAEREKLDAQQQKIAKLKKQLTSLQ